MHLELDARRATPPDSVTLGGAGVTDSGLFCWKSDSPGAHEARAGCLALGGVMLFFLAMSALDTTVLLKTRDVELTWIDGHADSRFFRIIWPGTYVFALQLADSSVPTRDQAIAWAGGQSMQRCGRPFTAGFTWSVRRFERTINQRMVRTSLWCEDPSQGHELGAGIGSFRARPGSGYSIRIEPNGQTSSQNSARLPLHIHLRLLSRWFDGTPILMICGTLILFGVTSIALGCARLIRGRF